MPTNLISESESLLNLKLARQDLLQLKSIFDKAGINFWLHCGTLLGAIRDRNLIPYDTDIDFRILARFWKDSAYNALEKKFRCRIVRPHAKFEVATKMVKYIQLRGHAHIPMNIAFAYYYAPGRVFVTWPLHGYRCNALTPEAYYKKSQFIRLFGELFRVPYDPVRFLNRLYYGDWMIPSNDKSYWSQGRRKISLAVYYRWFGKHLDYIKTKGR